MFGKFTLFKHLTGKALANGQISKGLLMVIANLDGFSLANCRRFPKVAKLSTHQTFLLYLFYKSYYFLFNTGNLTPHDVSKVIVKN